MVQRIGRLGARGGSARALASSSEASAPSVFPWRRRRRWSWSKTSASMFKVVLVTHLMLHHYASDVDSEVGGAEEGREELRFCGLGPDRSSQLRDAGLPVLRCRIPSEACRGAAYDPSMTKASQLGPRVPRAKHRRVGNSPIWTMSERWLQLISTLFDEVGGRFSYSVQTRPRGRIFAVCTPVEGRPGGPMTAVVGW